LENSFDGFADEKKLNLTIDMVNQSAGEIIGTVNYPEAFEDMELIILGPRHNASGSFSF